MTKRLQRGFNLIEVLMAIAIFAIGMLALASLQGSLTRSGADAKLRTMAANIAERTIEGLRSFDTLGQNADADAGVACVFGGPADAASSACGFGDIVDIDGSTAAPIVEVVSSGDNIGFFRTINVTDYYKDTSAAGGFSTTVPDGTAPVPDIKLVEVCIAWGDAALCPLDTDGTGGGKGGGKGGKKGTPPPTTPVSDFSSDTDLHTGNISVSAIVSRATAGSRLGIFTQEESDYAVFGVAYAPGEQPDVIPLDLGDGILKETLTPKPDIFRGYLETRFEVVTYSQSDNTFRRREENLAIACECVLRAPTEAVKGRRPMLWNGDEYLDPEFVVKPYGEEAEGVKQSPFCDICCRDHHDGGTGEDDPSGDAGAIVYGPFRDGGEYRGDGDHKHYKRQRSIPGLEEMDEAGYGDTYLEACRLVRNDGFFRVAQDYRMEGLNAFPGNYLASGSQISEYAGYVMGEVNDYVAGNGVSEPYRVYDGTCPETSPRLSDGYTCLPTGEEISSEFQQLTSRGMYFDYISEDLDDVVKCVQANSTQPFTWIQENCKSGKVELDKTGSTNHLELLSFFELQTTWLNDWEEDPVDYIATVTSEPVESDSTHSRGWAEAVLGMAGKATAFASGNRGVVGLTATDPIDNNYLVESITDELVLKVGDAEAAAAPAQSGISFNGKIFSYVSGVHAANVTLTPSGAVCNFTNPEFSCVREEGAAATVEINIAQATRANIEVCSNSDTLPIDNYVPAEWADIVVGTDPLTGEPIIETVVVAWDIVADISVADGGDYVIWLTSTGCG